MKKLLVSTLLLISVLSVSACGEKNEKTSSGTETIGQVQNEAEEESQNNEKSEDSIFKNASVELAGTYKVPLEDVYIDVPAYKEIEKGYTEIFIVYDEKYVAFTALYEEQVSTLQEAHEMAFGKCTWNVQNYTYVNEANIVEESNETINGIDVYHYEGTLNCGQFDSKYDVYMVGYSFIMSGFPCNITGVVEDEGQSEELKEEIRNTVDAMMQSVRTEE